MEALLKEKKKIRKGFSGKNPSSSQIINGRPLSLAHVFFLHMRYGLVLYIAVICLYSWLHDVSSSAASFLLLKLLLLQLPQWDKMKMST